jgi:prepilin-type N-terminal cleavage/methylation domain-containing protein
MITVRTGFTLVELLVVVAIMAIMMALALNIPTADKRRIEVEAVARDLAGTLRQARALALERRAGYAVSFNIANAPGTSGRVINNWAGGHWYQIIGPAEQGSLSATPCPRFPEPKVTFSPDQNLTTVIRQIAQSWYGERKVLPARKVRFLALSDQDLGHVHVANSGSAVLQNFPTSYPRPWCGWFDANAGRLYPWGGYDPSGAIKDSGNRPCSGFYYQGGGAVVPDSRNPVSRASTINGKDLLTAGDVRPLVNGEWLDFYIRFMPDGTVDVPAFGQLRSSSYELRKRPTLAGAATGSGDLGDFMTQFSSAGFDPTGLNNESSSQAASCSTRSGSWYITIAPDAETDTDTFPSVGNAVRSLMPAVRVGISSFGDVRIVNVRSALPDGRSLDGSIAANQWQTPAITNARYQGNVLTEVDGTARGAPVVDAIIPEMLLQRSWWLAP